MELSKLIINAVLQVCFLCQFKVDMQVMSGELLDTSQSDDEKFVNGSVNRNQDKLPCCVSIFYSIADILHSISNNNTIVNITTDVVLSSNMTFKNLENITIIGHRNLVVTCNDVGTIKFMACKNVTIKDLQWEGCGSDDYSGIEFYNSSDVSFERCSFHISKGRSILLSKVFGDVHISHCNFTHSKYSGHGAAIHYSPNANKSTQYRLVVQNSKFLFNRATQSVVYIDDSGSRRLSYVYLQDSMFVNNIGVPVYISHTNLHFKAGMLFKGNTAASGGGIYCNNSTVLFHDKTNVNFISNSVTNNGGGISQIYSRIVFKTKSTVTFWNNTARSGGAIASDNAEITFDGNSSVIFDNNEASNDGGAVCSWSSSVIKFDGNSSVTFNNNKASYGGAVYCEDSSNITFDGNSSVTFNNNEVSDNGAVVYCQYSSNIKFGGNSNVTFNKNKAGDDGGSIYCRSSSNITFDDNSSVTFDNNKASDDAGAILCFSSSNITFDGNSIVTFNNNKAKADGGAVHCVIQCDFLFYKTTSVTFINNSAISGGAIFSQGNSNVAARENSSVQFMHNTATRGGAICFLTQTAITLKDNCVMIFQNNSASESGGALYIYDYSTALFTGYSEVTYSNNKATQYGGAIYCSDASNITLDQNILMEFTNNTSEYGGALSIVQSTLKFDGNTSAKLTNNIAERGGAFYVLLSRVAFEGSITANFCGNAAENGGAISVVKSSIKFTGKSKLWLLKNSAAGSGGAMHLSDNFIADISYNSHITFNHNTANRHGGAIFCDLTKGTMNKIILNTSNIVLMDNADLTSSDVYVDVPRSCDEMCLNKSIINKTSNYSGGVIKTSPRRLEINDSAVTCTVGDNDINCEIYSLKNIMLGQEIVLHACVLDYYNQSAGSTQFELSSEDQDHEIIGSHNVLISCELFEGVSLKGKRILEPTNYSMIITLYDGSNSDLKKFSIKLITELSPCHPGFHYDNDAQTCICYSDNDIVSCSGSASSIRRGYWYGEINDKPTVTICPNNYCNFSCCETANAFLRLSPVRVDQCNSQRSGTACGSCKEGYTLSFDSIECVNVDKCSAGQTVLVVILSILYWVVIVILVFIVTYYHIGIGYLYAITYYYSVVDILLSEHLYLSQGLFTFISIMSSTSKVTPQFLGQLCLVPNMSGIDQQFIHYAHPLAVAIIVALICVSARMSYKFSLFLSRGIIHVICFLLLLSYTSVATTSLLLLRSLTFKDVEKVYTYVSPDIEYFHGRHLPYVIIAIICSLFIVVGLPLVLLLEPFLNHKINFTRIKPLLDQFQGCYKDKYRCFAAYYMACRLVVILIIIADPSNNDTSQYLLIIANCTLALIHVTFRSYRSNILNVFDSFVLQLMIVVSIVPVIDSYDPDLLVSFMIVLVVLPLIPFVLMEIYLSKNKVKKFTNCFVAHPDSACASNEVPMRDYFESVIDDSSRVNATVCSV